MTTPASELRAAADKVRSWEAEQNAARWAPSAIAAFGPDLADWLETTADYAVVSISHPTHVRALAVARQINAVGSPAAG